MPDDIEKNQKEIREFYGGNIEAIVCGGVMISEEIIELHEKANIRLVRGYGITECSPVVSVMHYNKKYDNKSVGTPVRCNEVRINNNEIQVKGSNVMLGYLKNEKDNETGLDSFGLYNLISEFEDEFNIKISNDEVTHLKRISDVINLIASKALVIGESFIKR